MFRKKEKPKIEVERWCAIVKVADGKVITDESFFFIDPTRLNCSIPEFNMIEVKSRGYFKDKETFYPWQSVTSIQWCLQDKGIVIESDNPYTVEYSSKRIVMEV